MAYSPDDLKILLYGGRLAGPWTFVNDVWVYDTQTTTWTKMDNWDCDPSCPKARAVHSMVYDSNKKLFVVFGGYLIKGHSFETNETWTYDLGSNKWTKLDFGSQAVPDPRHWGSLEYNPDQKVTYLFGGHFNNALCPVDKMYNDVWRLNITGSSPVWTNMNPTPDPTNGLPAPRQSDWIYNKLDKNHYVFGGKQDLGPPEGAECGSNAKDIETFYNDLWKYDPLGNQWTLIQSVKGDYTHYPKERRTDIIYDDSSNSLMFFSGLDGSNLVYGQDTWLYDFDDSRWSTLQDTDGVLPHIRKTMSAVWDDFNNVMYIYGADWTNAAAFWKLKIAKSNVSISCFDKQPMIFGTDSNDASVVGNDAVNVIAGLKGDDKIIGDLGSDYLCGGTGNDKIYGDGGNDRLYGYGGNDEIHGGSGNDSIRGGSGNDTLYGEAGKDTFDCSSGTDTIKDFNASEGDSKKSDCEVY